MDVQFHGHACVSIKSKEITVVMDPYDDSTGLKLPKLSAGAVTSSFDSPAHRNLTAVAGNRRVFDWPGEYEHEGVHFKGIHSFHNARDDKDQLENIVFFVNIKGIRFCHLGAQGTKLTPEQLERVGDIDVLFVPVGGKGCLDAQKAKEVVEQIEPRLVIPIMYNTAGSKAGLGTLEAFLSLMGAKGVEPLDQFSVKRNELPEDNSKVVVLNAV